MTWSKEDHEKFSRALGNVMAMDAIERLSPFVKAVSDEILKAIEQREDNLNAALWADGAEESEGE